MKQIAKTLILSGALFGLTACSSNQTTEPPKVGVDLVWSTHDERPEWLVKTPQHTEEEYRFVGFSFKHATERSARDAAFANAASKVVQHAAIMTQKHYELQSKGKTPESKTITNTVEISDLESIEAIGIIRNLHTKDIYIEQWKMGSSTFFKATALVSIDNNDFQDLMYTPQD